MRRIFLKSAMALAVGLGFGASAAVAEDYPSQPVTMVIPFGPGGASDVFARVLAGSAPEYLGQPVVAVNKAGAAGTVGSAYVVNAEPDGYTMLAGRVGPQMSGPAMNKTIPYTWDGFTIIALVDTNPFVLVVPGDSEIEDFGAFRTRIEAGEDLSYASAGVGSLLHVASLVMADAMGADPDGLTHIPYQGGGKARAALVGGQVDFMWQNLSGVIGAIEAGQLRALAVTTGARFAAIPDVPTVGELGFETMEAIIGWDAIYGPPDLPQEVVTVWLDTLEKLKADEAWVSQMEKLGNVIDIRGPDETKAFVGKQYGIFDETIRKLGMRVE